MISPVFFRHVDHHQEVNKSGWCSWRRCITCMQTLGAVLGGSAGGNPICISDSEEVPAPATSAAASGSQLPRMDSKASLGQSSVAASTPSAAASSSFAAQEGDSECNQSGNQSGQSGQMQLRRCQDSVVAPGKSMVDQLLHYHTQPDSLFGMTQEDLVQLVRSASAVLHQRSERVESLSTANKRLKRQATQLERDWQAVKEITKTGTNSQAIKKIKTWASTKRSTLELQTRGHSNKRLTAESVLSVGLRRNFSNIAACDFGSTILFPLSHQTVTRCEVRTSSALKGSLSSFVLEGLRECYELHDACKDLVAPTRSYSLMTIALRSDATNSSIWRRQKLHLCEVTAGFSLYIEDSLTTDLKSKAFQQRRLLFLD